MMMQVGFIYKCSAYKVMMQCHAKHDWHKVTVALLPIQNQMQLVLTTRGKRSDVTWMLTPAGWTPHRKPVLEE